MTVHLVANPAAGAGKAADRVQSIHARLSATAAVETHVPSSADDARSLLDDLADAEAERVIVAGGDGMVHLAVNALARSETVLGIVPVGTGNDAATGLGLPKKLEAACDAALGPHRPIDLIAAGSPDGDTRYAVTVAIVGLAVDINERAERMRFPKGSLKYTIATLAELPRLRRHELTMTIDGVEHDLVTNLLAIANLPYFGGGMRVAPDADPADGSLEVISIGPANPLTIGTLLPTIFSGRHVKNKRVTVLRGAEVTVAGQDLRVRADGEAWGELPATLRSVSAGLLIATPV
ncbi:MAG: diacylglycerol kinase family protein [Actinomycetota bacterium]